MRRISQRWLKIAKYFANELMNERSDVISVLVCGSFAEGFSDPRSDIDILVVTENYSYEDWYNVKNLEFHVKYKPRRELESAISDKAFTLIRWIKNSVIINDEKGFIIRLRKNIDDNLHDLALYVVHRSIDDYEDALASFEKGDFYASLASARLASQKIVQALLLSMKKFNLKERWLYTQLKCLENIPEIIIRNYCSINDLEQVNIRKAKDTLLSVARMINWLSSGQGGEVGREDSKPFRNPFVVWLVHQNGSIEISCGRDARIHELNPPGAFIWNLCSGKNTVQDIANATCREYKVTYDKALRDSIPFMAKLRKKGLII